MQLRVAGGHKLLGWCLLRSRITRAAETGSRYEIKERTANHIRTRHENCLSCFEKRLASMISCYSRTEKSSTLLFRLPVWSSSAFLQSKKLCSGKASPEFSNKLFIHSRPVSSSATAIMLACQMVESFQSMFKSRETKLDTNARIPETIGSLFVETFVVVP